MPVSCGMSGRIDSWLTGVGRRQPETIPDVGILLFRVEGYDTQYSGMQVTQASASECIFVGSWLWIPRYRPNSVIKSTDQSGCILVVSASDYVRSTIASCKISVFEMEQGRRGIGNAVFKIPVPR